MMKIKKRKLKGAIKRIITKGKDLYIDLNSLQVYGVSKESGVIVTGKEIGKDLSKYYYFEGQKFAYNPYRANIGSIGLTNPDFKGLISPAYVIFEVDNSIHPEFLLAYLKSPYGLNEIKKYANRGGIRSSLRLSDLEKVNYPDISIGEQENFMKKYNNKSKQYQKILEEYNKQNEHIEEFRQSILEEAVTGKLTAKWRQSIDCLKEIYLENNFPLSDNEKLLKNSCKITNIEDFTPLPKSWILCKFRDIANIASKLVNPNDYLDLPHIAPNSILKNRGVLTNYNLVKEDNLKSSKNLFYKDQILYSKIRPHLNKVVIANFNGLCSADMYPIDSYIDKKYLFYFMLSSIFLNQTKKVEGRVAMPKINQSELYDINVLVPPLEEQKMIGLKVEKLFQVCDDFELESKNNIDIAQEILVSSFIDLLGEDINLLMNNEKKLRIKQDERFVKFDSKTTLMDLVELLQKHGKLHAEDIWKMSKFPESIDAFYAELKHQIEVIKSIKEVENEKGYLELV